MLHANPKLSCNRSGRVGAFLRAAPDLGSDRLNVGGCENYTGQRFADPVNRPMLQRVQHVGAVCVPTQVAKTSIGGIAIIVTGFHAFGTRAYERLKHKAVDPLGFAIHVDSGVALVVSNSLFGASIQVAQVAEIADQQRVQRVRLPDFNDFTMLGFSHFDLLGVSLVRAGLRASTRFQPAYFMGSQTASNN